MVGEFLSGGVCRKENGENCSADAVVDGKCVRVCPVNVCIYRLHMCALSWREVPEAL